MFEAKFMEIAVCESNAEKHSQFKEWAATAHLMGAIGQLADDQDSFIQAGVEFIQNFKESAAQAIEDINQNEDPDKELIAVIKELVKEVKQVDLQVFKELLAGDWNDRHEDEDAE